MLLSERNAATTSSGECEDCVGNRRRNWRRCKLADAAQGMRTVYKDGLDDRALGKGHLTLGYFADLFTN